MRVDLWTFGRARPAGPPVAEHEPQQSSLDDREDRRREDRDPFVRVADARCVRRVRRLGGEPAVARVGDGSERQRGAESKYEDKGLAPHRRWHPTRVDEYSRVHLPKAVGDRYEVYVNGVRQEPGLDFDRIGDQLVFRRVLAQEGRLGPIRWLSMLLGVAGTYRKHENVDVLYEEGGRRTVATLSPGSDP